MTRKESDENDSEGRMIEWKQNKSVSGRGETTEAVVGKR